MRASVAVTAPQEEPWRHSLYARIDAYRQTKCVFMWQGCRGPVHGVVAEHWAVYSYWNALERRPQVRAY